MFKKWFSRLRLPPKLGIPGLGQADHGKFAKIFELELSNMEGTPSYTLTHQLTIGSEIGNIVIADPSVSPRHSTFILQQEVISVIDHSSVAGTFINGKKISPGKYIILEESDVIAVGDLEIRIKVRNEAFPEETEVPEAPEDLPAYEPATPASELKLDNQNPHITMTSKTVLNVAPVAEEKKVVSFKVQPTSAVPSGAEGNSAGNKAKKKFKIGFKSYHSANTLVRILSIIGDLVLALIVIEICLPFDDFRHFLEFLPTSVASFLDFDPEYLWDTILSDVPELKTIWDETTVIISKAIPIGPIIITFFLIRLLTTIIFGVSISEFMMGMRAIGNGIWNRIGGILRVLLGIVTGPLLIFDLPALFSRRTFKEFMTFTNTDNDSKPMVMLGLTFYYPFLIVFFLLSPLFQGLEILEPIDISSRIDKKLKVVIKEGEVPEEVPVTADSSKVMGMSLKYATKDVTIIPGFKFTGGRKTIQFQGFYTFYLKEFQRPVIFELYKTFDLKELIEMGLKHNFMLFEKFPELYSYTHATTDKSFQKNQTKEGQTKFAKEFVDYTRLAFGLTIDNALEVAQTQTFIFKNLVDYKSALLSLLEDKEFNMINLLQVGDTHFLKTNYISGKPYDLIIPLTKGPGKIFKVSFDKREKIKDVTSKMYYFILSESNWLNPTYTPMGEKMTAFEAHDFLTTLDLKAKTLDEAKLKALYGFYFELSADILKRADAAEYGILKKSVQAVVLILERLVKPQVSPDVLMPGQEILKSFKDLSERVETRNMSFFGLEQNI